jgi:phage baseplate assembly protein gpV
VKSETDRILQTLVRVGKVSALDTSGLCAKVYFADLNIVSDWLPVIQHRASVAVEANENHSHLASTKNWMPAVNENVLCLFLPMFNSDGYILGAIP